MTLYKELRDEDIEGMLFDPGESEDDLDKSDSEMDENCILTQKQLDSLLGKENILEFEANNEEFPPPSNSSTSFGSTRSIVWKKGNLNLKEEQLQFRGDSALSESMLTLQTPYQFYKYFVDDDLIKEVVEQSNLYSTQKNTDRPFCIHETDLYRYLGIIILSSIVQPSNIRMFWDEAIGIDLEKETMSQKEFEKIRSILHFNDNTTFVSDKCDPRYDSLHKLRPVINHLNFKFQSVPKEESLSVDEQICATKCKHYLKQYMPAKPHKWGYKLFVLCGVSGFAYKFEIYAGKENPNVKPLPEEPDLGASSNVVIRLLREVPKGVNHKVYFDNYYTSIQLITYLAKEGIHSLGTVRRNRIPNCKVPSDKNLNKTPRGTSVEFIGNYDNIVLSNVAWKDNRPVLFLSNFVGELP